MSIIIKDISYIHPDREILFQHVSFSVPKSQKVSLIGRNGTGKSTLLKIIGGVLQPAGGEIILTDKPYYVPQHFGQYDNLSVAEALGIDNKLQAMHAILEGDASTDNFTALDDDWNIEERALYALTLWDLHHAKLSDPMNSLSGGEKTKVFLAGLSIHCPSVILLDEPTNHLDGDSRKRLYQFIENTKSTVIVVSHDRNLLNLIDTTYELNKNGVKLYGGNYEFYKMQKEEELEALQSQLSEKEKQLRMARKTAREAAERKQRSDARGEKKQVRAGTPRIMMNTIKNKAEQSASKLKETHNVKMEGISEAMTEIRKKLPDSRNLKIDFEDANLHRGKILVDAEDINFAYHSDYLWKNPLSFKIRSGDRIVIKGRNGSGKTTLINIITGKLKPSAGKIVSAASNYLYLDQEYSLIDNRLTVLEQAQQFNQRKLLDHELKQMLNRFLFPVGTWDKNCGMLSGGEKIRLVFCCLSVFNKMPDMFILDEPTNNLDIQSLEIVTSVIKDYQGTVVLITHDQYFIDEVGINGEIIL